VRHFIEVRALRTRLQCGIDGYVAVSLRTRKRRWRAGRGIHQLEADLYYELVWDLQSVCRAPISIECSLRLFIASFALLAWKTYTPPTEWTAGDQLLRHTLGVVSVFDGV
jgi:hypothetical protein